MKSDNSKVMILTHGLYPVPGYTVSGNGIRAWGLAMGLVHKGFQVIYSTPLDTVHPHTPRPEVTLVPYSDKTDLERLIELHSPDVLIIGYWAYMHLIPQDIKIPLVMDILAPWLLEADFQDTHDIESESINYIKCLSRADYFLCCTQRQKAFHTAWLFMSGFSSKNNLLDVIPISADPNLPIRSEDIYKHNGKKTVFLYGGVLWPWRSPQEWITTLLEILVNDNSGQLQLITGKYPLHEASSSASIQLPEGGQYDAVLKKSDLLPYDEMEKLYLQADIGIELSTRNTERELSFSFRVIDYLRCGLPVICNDFLEVAELIKEYDAGWVIESSNNGAFERIIRQILSGEEDISQKSRNARRLIIEKLNFLQTIEPLASFCQKPYKCNNKRHFIFHHTLNNLHSNIDNLKKQIDNKDSILNTQYAIVKQLQIKLDLWEGIAEERRLKIRFKRFKNFITMEKLSAVAKLLYRAIVKKFLIPLWRRRGKKNLAIITRDDVFPVDHGAAAKIYHTARVLSFAYDEVYLITMDREKFYIFRHGAVYEELYPRLLRSMFCLNEDVLRKRITNIGIPTDDAFLFFPMLDNNFKLRVLYVALQKSISVYQAEFPSFIDACSWALQIFGGKSSIVEHNIEFQRISNTYQLSDDIRNYMKNYEVKLCNSVDHVITVSTNDTKGLIEAGVSKDKITMIPHGVDLENFEINAKNKVFIKDKYGIALDKIVLIFHGIYSYAPNGEAAKLIGTTILPALNAKGYYPKCLAVGKYPPSQSNHPDLIYTDVVDHVAPYISAADIAVVPLQDGGGTRMKILEYFAGAIPVVATSKGAEGIEVINGEEILIEDDMNKFIDSIIQLIDSPDMRLKVGLAGRDFVDKLDWRKIGKRYVDLYK